MPQIDSILPLSDIRYTSPWLKKILKFDLMVCPRLTQFDQFMTLIILHHGLIFLKIINSISLFLVLHAKLYKRSCVSVCLWSVPLHFNQKSVYDVTNPAVIIILTRHVCRNVHAFSGLCKTTKAGRFYFL